MPIRVYLSSSFRDLEEVRTAVIAHVNKQKEAFFLVNMEDYPAEAAYPADKCVADVESCDVYVGIFAWRYGQIEPRSRKSITELELLAAERKRIEILAYVLHRDAPWPKSQMDNTDRRITTLRKHVTKNHIAQFFKNQIDICPLVVSGLNAARDRIGAKTTGKENQEFRLEAECRIRWIIRGIENDWNIGVIDNVRGGDVAQSIDPKHKRSSLLSLIYRGWGKAEAQDSESDLEKLCLSHRDLSDPQKIIAAHKAWQQIVQRLGLAIHGT